MTSPRLGAMSTPRHGARRLTAGRDNDYHWNWKVEDARQARDLCAECLHVIADVSANAALPALDVTGDTGSPSRGCMDGAATLMLPVADNERRRLQARAPAAAKSPAWSRT